MAAPKFTKLEMQIMQALWDRGAVSIREIQEAFPKQDMPSYTTVQTTVYRLETKKAVRRVKKIGNAHIFEAIVSRADIRGKLLDDLLNLFGGGPGLLMAHMIETGRLTGKDIQEAEEALSRFKKGSDGK